VFLTVDQLILASKRTRPKAQLAWALDRGFIPDARHTDADGRPLVPLALFEAQPAQTARVEPRFEALRGT
jgi:hypothetical protein